MTCSILRRRPESHLTRLESTWRRINHGEAKPFYGLQWNSGWTSICHVMSVGISSFLFLFLLAGNALANPYLAKPGERPLSMRVSTCAVSGGFVHLYTALDNGLFEKYGLKFENIFIRGSGANLSALAG